MSTFIQDLSAPESTAERAIGRIFPSDLLGELRKFAQHFQGLEPLLKTFVRFEIVMDASEVHYELTWRLRARLNPKARSNLHEAIDSGIVVALAPMMLRDEIEEHIHEIANRSGVSSDQARQEWQDFQSLLHFYEPTPHLNDVLDCVDPNDAPYRQVHEELGTHGVYTNDKHFLKMGVPVLTVTFNRASRDYARAKAIQVGLTLSSGLTVTVSLKVAWECLKAIAAGWQRLPDRVKLVLIAATAGALLHPKSRTGILEVFRSVRRNLAHLSGPAMELIDELANHYLAADQKAKGAELEINASLQPRKRRSALAHAKVICLTAKRALSTEEIARRMLSEGYVSRSKTFVGYLRRVLRNEPRFVNIGSDLWTLQQSIC